MISSKRGYFNCLFEIFGKYSRSTARVFGEAPGFMQSGDGFFPAAGSG